MEGIGIFGNVCKLLFDFLFFSSKHLFLTSVETGAEGLRCGGLVLVVMGSSRGGGWNATLFGWRLLWRIFDVFFFLLQLS